jgi:hypothetical protein
LNKLIARPCAARPVLFLLSEGRWQKTHVGRQGYDRQYGAAFRRIALGDEPNKSRELLQANIPIPIREIYL